MVSTKGSFAGTLQPHQRDAVEWLRARPKALLADEVGLGKTIEAIAHICDLYDREIMVRGRDVVMWITASNLIEQTRGEFEQFAPSLRILSQTDTAYGQSTAHKRAEYARLYPDGPDVVLVSFEGASKSADVLWRRFGRPALTLIDEVMVLKSIDSKKHKAIREMTKDCSRILTMTATPYETSPMETFGVLRLMHTPDLWSETEFGSRFVEWTEAFEIPQTGKWVEAKPVGFVHENLPELREYLHRFMLRRTAAELGLPIPVKVGETDRTVVSTAAQKRAYASASKMYGGVGHIKRTQVGREIGGESSLVDAFLETLDDDFAGEKVIVYCETLNVLTLLETRLEELEIGHRAIAGSTPVTKRERALADFRDDPDVRVFIGSRVLELGLNIQHARVLVTLDPADNPQRETQREGRIKRIGSPHGTYRHLTLWPDTRVARDKYQRLAKRRRDADLLLTDPTAA